MAKDVTWEDVIEDQKRIRERMSALRKESDSLQQSIGPFCGFHLDELRGWKGFWVVVIQIMAILALTGIAWLIPK